MKMITIYWLIIFEWLDMFTYIFSNEEAREAIIEAKDPESYRTFQYQIEEIYDAVDYTYCLDKNI